MQHSLRGRIERYHSFGIMNHQSYRREREYWDDLLTYGCASQHCYSMSNINPANPLFTACAFELTDIVQRILEMQNGFEAVIKSNCLETKCGELSLLFINEDVVQILLNTSRQYSEFRLYRNVALFESAVCQFKRGGKMFLSEA